jgi:DNA-binding MarR family transcriptional regulator
MQHGCADGDTTGDCAMELMHQFLTDKYDWYEACQQQHDKARGHLHIKPTLVQLLKHMERDQGSRIALLAVRMGVSRRRVSQIAAEGVEAGILDLVDDPDDARVSIVQISEGGQAILDAAIESMHEIEAELARRIGRENLAQLTRLLKMDWGPAVLPADSADRPRPKSRLETQ